MVSIAIKNVMIKNIITYKKTDLVRDIAKTMAERQISCVVIVERDSPIGIITERDIIKRIVSKGISVDGLKAQNIMSSKLMTVKEDDNVFEVAKMMEQYKIRRVPVVRGKKLVGLITETDLVNAMTKIVTELNKNLVRFIQSG